MKRKVVGVILAGMLILSACSFSNVKETNEDSAVVVSEETVSEETASEEAVSEEVVSEEAVSEEAASEEAVSDELIEKAVAEAGADISDARYPVVYDFDNDDVLEAFVYIGDAPDNYAASAGEVWYVDGDKAEMIKQNDSFFVHGDKVIDMYPIGDSVAIEFGETHATYNVSYLYLMENGKWKESEISGLGYFFIDDYVSDYCVSVSEYDAIYEYEEGREEEGIIIGHSWKYYYFYYDEVSGDFKEYVGKDISEDELKEVCGSDLAAEIRDAGFQVDDIFKRDNGIINVNYSKIEKSDFGTIDKEFHNVTYNELNRQYINAYGTDGGSWQDSDFRGTYLRAVTER